MVGRHLELAMQGNYTADVDAKISGDTEQLLPQVIDVSPVVLNYSYIPIMDFVLFSRKYSDNLIIIVSEFMSIIN